MEDLQKIKLDVKNRLAHITLNDPPENYLSIQMLGELAETLDFLPEMKTAWIFRQ